MDLAHSESSLQSDSHGQIDTHIVSVNNMVVDGSQFGDEHFESNLKSDSHIPINRQIVTAINQNMAAGESQLVDTNVALDKYALISKDFKPQIRRVLKDHQIEGINFMNKNVADGSGCILAHSMGLGKTIQVITLCDMFLQKHPARTVLMLMPVNTIRHSLSEFDYWLPLHANDSLLATFGNVTARSFNVHTIKETQRTIKDRLPTFEQWSANGGVLILGYELFRSLILQNLGRKRARNENFNIGEENILLDKVKEILVQTNLIICDEGHKIKHMDTQIFVALQQLHTNLRVVLTGYPLQNNLKEYYTVVNYVKPNLLGDENEFEILFEKPITMGQYSDSTPAEVQLMEYRSHVLRSLLAPFVHRRCEKLLHDTLPEKIEYTFMFRMTTLQKQLYKQILSQTNNNPINAFSIICKIMNDPNVLFDYLQNEKQRDIEDGEKEEKLYYKFLLPVMDTYVPTLIDTSPKMIALFEIIHNTLEQNDKIIIFSQSLLTLNMMERCLESALKWKKNQHFYRIDGSTTQQSRQSMIQKFNKNHQSKVFLLSTKAGCLGINLIAANRVVVFDASFNPSDDLQAIGRIYRYGQAKNTFVYRFVMDKSLERSIFDHQVKKQQMSFRLIDKANPEPYMSSKSASSSYFKYEEDSEEEIEDFSERAMTYTDIVMKNFLISCSVLLTQEPLQIESFLVDNNENKLSENEALLAKIDYKLAKAAFTANNDIADSSFASNVSSHHTDDDAQQDHSDSSFGNCSNKASNLSQHHSDSSFGS